MLSAKRLPRAAPKRAKLRHAHRRRGVILHARRELVRLVCDRPLPQPLDELVLKGLPKEPLQAFLTDQGFRSLLGKLGDLRSRLPGRKATQQA